jgi:O-antigen ligase
MPSDTRRLTAGRRLWISLFVVFLIVVISVVPWRRGTLFAGDVDDVVVAKAAVAILGLGLAVLVRGWSAARTDYDRLNQRLREFDTLHQKIGVRTLALFAAIVVVASLGAVAAGDAASGLVLSVRIVMAATTVALLVASAPPMVSLVTLLSAMATVAVFAAITGVLLGEPGRLAGGIPEMAPNVLAGIAGPPLVAISAHVASRGIRLWNSAAFVALLAIVLATGSRTTLLVVVIGIVIVLMHVQRLPASAMVGAIASVPVFFALIVFSNTVTETLTRGQSLDELSTFSSRTVAWQAVLATPLETWDKWIGVGLAAKTVEVQERWRDVQVLDSSWVSIIAQAGIIGTLLLIAWAVTTFADSIRRRDIAVLTTPLLVYLLIRGFTENGLIESSPTFVLFLVISLIVEPTASHQSHRGEASTMTLVRG